MQTIRAQRIFDGHDLIHSRAVVVDGGRITAILDDADDALDLGDVTLMPGLIDTHVHLAFDASPDPIARLDEDGLYERMRTAAKQHLAAGVTTIRDLGDKDYLAIKLAQEFTDGPEILSAGAPITSPRGHCWFLGGEVEGEAGIREAVRERAARGAKAIKMMVTGGEMTPGTHSHLLQFTPAEIRAAAEEAHLHGLPITGHAHAGAGIAAALEAGFDSIEHVSFFTEDGVSHDHDLIARLADSGVFASLTVGVLPGFTPPPNIASRFAGLAEGMRLLRAAGVQIIGGSDAGIAPPKPHGILPYGGEMLVDFARCTPIEVLRSFTSLAARACRIDNRKGRIAPGFDADLLAVEGDPTKDHRLLQRPAAVFRRGIRTS
jgi:imidazolonepropionase-like amidohydrolase